MPISFDQSYFEGPGDLGYSDYATQHGYLEAERDFILANFDTAGIRVLDVGCGYGYLTKMLRDAGVDCVGVDISPFAISKDVTGGFIQQGDVRGNLPFSNNTFRLVLGVYVLECLETEADIDAAVTEIRRVAHPASAFYLVASLDSPAPHWRVTRTEFESFISSKFSGAVFSDGIAFNNPVRVVIK